MVHSAADLPNLTGEEAMGLFREVHANAVELVDEAQLLLAANHRSRAYFLAHIAHEEIAKCVGLLSIWCGLQIGSPANWKLFWRKWNSHGFKVQLAMAGDVMRRAVGELPATAGLTGDEELPPDAADQMRALVRAIDAQLPSHIDLVHLRNASIYVDFRDGQAVLPSEIISDAMARNMVVAAKSNSDFFAQVAKAVESALPLLAEYPGFNELLAVLAAAADDGSDPEPEPAPAPAPGSDGSAHRGGPSADPASTVA